MNNTDRTLSICLYIYQYMVAILFQSVFRIHHLIESSQVTGIEQRRK